MAPAVSIFERKSEFDPFLYAPAGEEGNGMLLSVQSAPSASRCGPVAGGDDLDQDAGSECDTPIDIAAFVSAVRYVDPAGSQPSAA